MNKNIFKTVASLSRNSFLQIDNNQKVKSFDTLGLLVRDNFKNQLKKFNKKNDKFSFFLSNNLDDFKYFLTAFNRLDTLVNSFSLVYKQHSSLKSDLIANNQINNLNNFNQCLE